MKAKEKKVIVVVCFALVLIGSFFMIPTGWWGTPHEVSIPLTIEPFGEGFEGSATKDVQSAIKAIRNSKYFTYFVDADGTKVPILDQFRLRIEDISSASAWTEMSLNTTYRRIITQSGELKLLPFAEMTETAKGEDLVSLKITGQMLRITPKYLWEVNPNLYRKPPGVLQDIYLVTHATVDASSLRKVQVAASGEHQSLGYTSKIAEDTARELSRVYTNAILGTWRTTIPDGVIEENPIRTIIYAKGQSIDLVDGKNIIPFVINRATEEKVSFNFAGIEFLNVTNTGYALYEQYAAICLKGLTGTQPQKLRIQLCTLNGKKLEHLGVIVHFKEPFPVQITPPLVVFMDSHLPDVVYSEETKAIGGSNADDILRYYRSNVLDFPIRTRTEATNLQWDDEERVRDSDPDLIVIHLSCFYESTHTDDSDGKFRRFLKLMTGKKTKFLVYTRGLPEEPDQELRRRWEQLVSAVEDPSLAGRAVLFRIPGGRKASFRDIVTVSALCDKIKDMLSAPNNGE